MPDVHALLRDLAADPRRQLLAVRTAGRERVDDPAVVAAIARLLGSREVSPRDASWALALHEPIAPAAAETLVALAATDDAVVDAVVGLIAAGSAGNWSFPQASFDQGGYIGEYGGEDVRPAVLACRVAQAVAARRPDVRPRLAAALAGVRNDADARVRDEATRTAKAIDAMGGEAGA
ncbi:MAG TPA: hypothetical protein VF796_13655 [Humisphaera sp.]